MRAREFINEQDGHMTKRQRWGTRGVTTFKDAERSNSDYVLNRVMMAVATADGSGKPIDVDAKSWIGKQRGAYPYTEIENEMLKQAFRAAGAEYDDLNDGDMRSQEPPGGNITSPVKGFQGYPR